MKLKITEGQYKCLVQHLVNETAKIRKFTDDDYQKVNPYQVKDVDFAAIKDSDDQFNQGKLKKNQVNTAQDLYGKNVKIQQSAIDAIQQKLTKSVQDKFKAETNREEPKLYANEIGIRDEHKDKLSRKLAENGFVLEIKGKTFSYGNSKLPESTMIVNLTSSWNCPSISKHECPLGAYCYAKHLEKDVSPSLRLRNLRNEKCFKYLSPKEILQLIEVYIEQAPTRIKNIRISEDGDFQDQATVDFVDKLAGHIEAKYGIKTTAYTHRVLDYSNLKHMKVNASSYDIKSGTRYFICCEESEWDKVPEGLVFGQNYELVSKDKNRLIPTVNGTFKCHCDCRKCNFCYNTKEQNGEPQNGMITVVEKLREK